MKAQYIYVKWILGSLITFCDVRLILKLNKAFKENSNCFSYLSGKILNFIQIWTCKDSCHWFFLYLLWVLSIFFIRYEHMRLINVIMYVTDI